MCFKTVIRGEEGTLKLTPSRGILYVGEILKVDCYRYKPSYTSDVLLKVKFLNENGMPKSAVEFQSITRNDKCEKCNQEVGLIAPSCIKVEGTSYEKIIAAIPFV